MPRSRELTWRWPIQHIAFRIQLVAMTGAPWFATMLHHWNPRLSILIQLHTLTLLVHQHIMPFISSRETYSFQERNNDTDVIINDIHFNQTVLDHYNYSLFSNGTLSNGSSCVLIFNSFRPYMLMNGTFINATSCYSPIEPLGHHGEAGISFAVMFAISVIFLLVNLRKHGKRYLPLTKRWRIVGRRWKWYWLLFVGTCGIISCFMSIDVDRDYLPGSALVLQSFFYCIMTPALMAAVWEAVRHW